MGYFTKQIIIMEPIHKFNNGDGATLCNICNTIITPFLTDELYCDKHKNMDKDEIIKLVYNLTKNNSNQSQPININITKARQFVGIL